MIQFFVFGHNTIFLWEGNGKLKLRQVELFRIMHLTAFSLQGSLKFALSGYFLFKESASADEQVLERILLLQSWRSSGTPSKLVNSYLPVVYL